MKKTLISLAVAGAFAAPVASVNAADVSGFADIILTITDESQDNTGGSSCTGLSATPPTTAGCLDNPAENQFAADGEIDFTHTVGAVTARADVNLSLSGATSGDLEQAFFAWQINPALTAIGGVFNNPIGQDAEDAPDMNFTSHSATYAVLDHQTAELAGNNIAGVALAGAIGPVTLTGAVLNDIGKRAGTKAEGQNSLALVANVSPSMVPGLDLELGIVTQEDFNATTNHDSAGNVYDFNASYNWMMVTAGLDYLVASDVVDNAYDVWVKGDAGMGVTLGARFSGVSWDANVLGNAADDNTATTLYAAYSAGSNLDIALEFKDGSGNTKLATSDPTYDDLNKLTGLISGINEGTSTTVEFIAKF